MKFTPINDYVLVCKCYKKDIERDGIVIARTDFDSEFTNLAQIISYSKNCKRMKPEYIKRMVLCPEYHSDMSRIDGEFFVVRENTLFDRMGAVLTNE